MDAGASVAEPAAAAAGAVGPGEVAGLADPLAPGPPGAPQLGAGLHEGAGPGPGPEGQLALALQAVGRAGQAGGQGELLLRLVQQTLAWRTQIKAQATGDQSSDHGRSKLRPPEVKGQATGGQSSGHRRSNLRPLEIKAQATGGQSSGHQRSKLSPQEIKAQATGDQSSVKQEHASFATSWLAALANLSSCQRFL